MSSITNSDLLIMSVLHDAFRRDGARLAHAAAKHRTDDPGQRAALMAGWRMFRAQLEHHHHSEDTWLWPVMRSRVADDSDALGVLDDMESEHGLIDPALLAVEDALADTHDGHHRLADRVDDLYSILTAHLAHEERDALSLVQRTLTAAEWHAAGRRTQRDLGLKGAAEAFPWMLDDAPPSRKQEILGLLPLPLRLVYKFRWKPAYRRTRRWS